ncbi:hypothetical protein Ddc_17281 [Ditylenchus destructor]|nr:hypothetical protein Ddc_17281 [Ditylenchus destructor]
MYRIYFPDFVCEEITISADDRKAHVNRSKRTEEMISRASANNSTGNREKRPSRGKLELTKKSFIEWSCLNQNDPRHRFMSRLETVGGYPFHIEIISSPFGGGPGFGDRYYPSFGRRFGIQIVCDHAFPEPSLRLAVKFSVTFKAKNRKFKDHTSNIVTVFSPEKKSEGILVPTEFVANPINGFLTSHLQKLRIVVGMELVALEEKLTSRT